MVIDARQGEQESRLEYWLKLINSFGDGSPTIVVINKTDEHPLDVNRRGLSRKYEFIVSFHDISCKTNDGIYKLRDEIISIAQELPHVNDLLPLSWFNMKSTLSQMKRDFISFDTYEELCLDASILDELSRHTLVDLLHDLSVILNFRNDPRLRDTNVLNPEWITNGVYKLLNSYQLFQSKGVLDYDELNNLLDVKKYPVAKHLFIVQLMEKFELCFAYQQLGRDRYLIPELLSKEEPDLDWNYKGSLALEFHYDVLPTSIMSRFIVRMNNMISMNTYWHDGVVLSLEDNKALVKADFEDRKIFVWITGEERTRRAFLAAVRQAFRAIHHTIAKIEAVEKVPYRGVLIDYEHLRNLEKLGEKEFVPEGLNQRASVSALLNGVDDRDTLREEASVNIVGPGGPGAPEVDDSPSGEAITSTDTGLAQPRVTGAMNTGGGDVYYASLWEKGVTVTAACAIILLVGFLVIRNERFADPNLVVLSRTILSVSVAVLGATIPGFLHVGWTRGGLVVRAGGALALFVLSFAWTPQVI